MKKRFLSLIATALMLPYALAAQTNTARQNRNEAGLEIGGAGLYYDLFYQQHLCRLANNITLNLRAGAGVFPLSKSFSGSGVGYTVHVMPTILFFSGRHAWEAGTAAIMLDQTRYNVELGTASGGSRKVNEVERLLLISPQGSYRYYFASGRIYLRGTVMLHIPARYWDSYKNDYTGLPLVPWAGISGGITF